MGNLRESMGNLRGNLWGKLSIYGISDVLQLMVVFPKIFLPNFSGAKKSMGKNHHPMGSESVLKKSPKTKNTSKVVEEDENWGA